MKKYLVSIFVLGLLGCNSSSGNTTPVKTAPPAPVAPVSAAKAADLVFTNARVYSNNASATVVAIKDKKISFIGTQDGAKAYINSNTRVVDARGNMLLPGFIDNHNHLGEGGGVSCYPKRELPLTAQAQLLAKCTTEVAAGTWIIGYGGDFSLEVKNSNSSNNPRKLLDKIFPQNPVIIMDYTSHAQFVNTLAYEKVGYDKNTRDPKGGILMKDQSGELNGILLDNAGDLVMETAINSVEGKFDIFVEGIKSALPLASKNGITTVGDGRTYWRRGAFEAWKTVAREGALTARISVRPWIYPDVEKSEQLNFLAGAIQNDLEQLLVVNQVKMYIDGVVEYGTGRVIAPYVATNFPQYPHGINYLSETEMQSWLNELHNLGYGAMIHAIGDLGVREALNAIKNIRNKGSQLRYNLTHLPLIDPEEIKRFAQLDVDADLQIGAPSFTPEQRMSSYLPFIGKARAEAIHHFPVQELIAANANLVLSSDYDVGPISPLNAISNVVEEGSMTIAQAIDAYTINAARALGLEKITGSIEVGKFADLVLINGDLTQKSPAQIRQTKTLATMVNGKFVFEAAN